MIKQILQIEHELLRIPTGGRLTSWLFTQRGGGVELGTTENKFTDIAAGRTTRDL